MVAKEKLRGRRLALTILLGIFVAIMLTIFVNLVVSYFYEGPQYDKYCAGSMREPYPIKYGYDVGICQNCTYSQVLQEQVDSCQKDGGNAVYNYDSRGCTVSLKSCDMCNKEFNDAQNAYNRRTFFIYAIVGFILIVFGLFASSLLFGDKEIEVELISFIQYNLLFE